MIGKPPFERALQARAKAARVDMVLELWRAQPLGFERRMVVGEVAIPTLASITPDQLALNEDAGSSLIAEGYGALSKASLDREFADWTPDLPPLPSTLDRQAEYHWIWRLSQSIGSIVWSEDGEAIRVSLGTAGVRELRVDGRPVKEGRWLEIKPVSIPQALHALALDYIENSCTLTIDLVGADPGNLSAAIDALAQRVRHDFAAVFGRERVQVRFALPDRKLGEPEFFKLVVRHSELALAMKRLWQAFNDGSSGDYQLDARYDGATAFFAHAALAYARLDPEAWRLLDLWFRRKPDHDSYGPDHVLPAISETNGWSDREVIEWGLRAMWREELQGSSGAVFPCVSSLVDQARLLYSATDFAVAVRAAGLDCAASDPDFADDSVAGIAHLFAPGPEASNLWDLSLLREFKRLGMAAKLHWV